MTLRQEVDVVLGDRFLLTESTDANPHVADRALRLRSEIGDKVDELEDLLNHL